MIDPVRALYDVLIVDDDPFQASLLEAKLACLGYACKVLMDGRRVLEEARSGRPPVVIMDIIMPGTDGLSLCKILKPVLDAWGGRIIVTSSKEREVEAPRALRAGAVAFLAKPYGLEPLRAALSGLLDAPQAKRSPPGAAVSLRIWGSRGAGRAPAAASVYGTKTPCISIDFGKDERLILDAGSGILDCAKELLAKPGRPAATLLLTHYHPAHVEGLAGLDLLTRPEARLRVGGPRDPDVDPRALLRSAGAKDGIEPFFLDESLYRLSEAAAVRTFFTNHPTTTLAFAVEANGRKVVYCPDSSLPGDGEADLTNNFDRIKQFVRGADLLLYDSHFSPKDAAGDEGHSSWEAAVRLGVDAGVRRLLLFHASMSYSDSQVAALEAEARERVAEETTSLECGMARDGQLVEL
ncbi:MAG: response regulator [Elusimicrobia bacterium]|nr:response regulator [Elusimicrobiota bacterium]